MHQDEHDHIKDYSNQKYCVESCWPDEHYHIKDYSNQKYCVEGPVCKFDHHSKYNNKSASHLAEVIKDHPNHCKNQCIAKWPLSKLSPPRSRPPSSELSNVISPQRGFTGGSAGHRSKYHLLMMNGELNQCLLTALATSLEPENRKQWEEVKTHALYWPFW